MSIQRKIKKSKIILENSKKSSKKGMSFVKKAVLYLLITAIAITLLIGLEQLQLSDIKRDFETKGNKIIKIEHTSQYKTPFEGETDSKGDRVIKIYYIDKQSQSKTIYAKYNTNSGKVIWKEE